jgi:hypothetical protein
MIFNYVARARSALCVSCNFSFPHSKVHAKSFLGQPASQAASHNNNGMNGRRRHGRDSDSKFSESRWWWDKNSNLDAEGKRKTTITITGAVFLAALWSARECTLL